MVLLVSRHWVKPRRAIEWMTECCVERVERQQDAVPPFVSIVGKSFCCVECFWLLATRNAPSSLTKIRFSEDARFAKTCPFHCYPALLSITVDTEHRLHHTISTRQTCCMKDHQAVTSMTCSQSITSYRLKTIS